MSGKLPVVKAREVIRVASRLGFVFDHQRGSHAVYYREKDGARIVVPTHSRRDLKPKTLASILDDVGVTMEQFRGLL